MIVTDKFVLINYPKTGTTFLRSAIKSIYEARETSVERMLRKLHLRHAGMRELTLPKLYDDRPPRKDQHGVYRQIPRAHRDKTIVSIVRNPLTRYVSSYVFGWWKKNPPFAIDDIRQAFPNFPDISFSDFYRLGRHPLHPAQRLSSPALRRIGAYTRGFLIFYSREPEAGAKRLREGSRLGDILPPITFFHQECLRDEFSSFLKEMGYSSEDIAKVRSTERANVGSESEKNSVPQHDLSEVAAAILEDERPVLDAFPEYEEQVVLVANGCALSQTPTPVCSGQRTLGR